MLPRLLSVLQTAVVVVAAAAAGVGAVISKNPSCLLQ